MWILDEYPKSTVGEDQVCDHLRNLKVYKSMGPNEINLRVLIELSNKVAKPLSLLNNCGSEVRPLMIGKKET